MISWDALTPDPDYRRRQQDLGLRRAVVSFNDRAVPGLGNLWFSMPVAWALLGLKIAADRNLNAVTVTNAIEALAMKAAHRASSGAVDKTVGSRLRGHRPYQPWGCVCLVEDRGKLGRAAGRDLWRNAVLGRSGDQLWQFGGGHLQGRL